jgi:phosphatidylethanolamine-binding protein (PEBP) family uncharacterized protein
MMRKIVLIMSIFVGFLLGAHAQQKRADPMHLSSNTLAAIDEIPSKYRCQGTNISPPLAWTNVLKGTNSFALICNDPDAPDPAAIGFARRRE